MTGRAKPARHLATRLDRVEHCLLLAETVVSILQSDSHVEHDNIITLLDKEVKYALEALAQVRQDLEVPALTSRIAQARQRCSGSQREQDPPR
jgi:hypothetical protein